MPSIAELAEICMPLIDQPAYTPRKLRVVTIGAGFAGLIFAHKVQHEQPDLQEFIEHTIFEANDGIGGTWRVNKYPGVQCDVPSHLYSLPFDPNPNWTRFYADGPEILEYLEHTCDKWNLRRDIQFNTKVTSLEWQEEAGRWEVQVSKGGVERVEQADFIISAQGFLSRWRWPSISGFESFQGHKVHSADWDHTFNYENKRIGIIGNGSSAIQILPQVARLPGVTLTSFQRNPTWITQSLGQILGGGKTEDNNFNPEYTPEQIREFQDPETHRAYRKKLQHGMNRGFRLFKKGSPENDRTTKATIERMCKALDHREDLCSQLIPDWTLGCRRLTPGENYLESFLLPNVKLTQSSITEITSTGIKTEDGVHYDLDVIICATGFDVTNIPHYPVVGRHGMTLAEKWKEEPESYLSLACPDFPNYFIFTGPNATVGHGTLITSLNWSAAYMVKWLRKCATEGIKSVVPKQSATDEFVRYGDEIHKTLTWTGGCKSWYKNNRVDGRVTATWPGSALLYKQMIGELRPEDFEIEYIERNRFARIMGNGFTILEGDDDADLSFYI